MYLIRKCDICACAGGARPGSGWGGGGARPEGGTSLPQDGVASLYSSYTFHLANPPFSWKKENFRLFI